jgi:putative peptidoglycan lipid II flippase
MNQIRKAGMSALFIIIFSLASKILGFFREILVASKFGSGMETDAYFVALTATSLLTILIWTAINTTLIPILAEIEFKEGPSTKIQHVNNMINIVSIITFILTILVWLLAPIIIKIMASGFRGSQLDLAISLTRIGIPKLIFSGSIGIFIAFLHSEQRFKSVSFIPMFSSFIIILYLLIFSNRFGIKGLMFASFLSIAIQLIVLLPEVKSLRYKYKFIIDIKDKYLLKLGYLIIPILCGTAINEINTLVDRTLASKLIAGSISALNYANKLNNLVLEVFIVAITTVIFPMLSKGSNSNNMNSMKKIMGSGINIILIITIPATVGLIILSKPIVEIAFERGAFDTTATMMTSQALTFYSLGLVAMALRLLITRVYYSLQDTKTPMINGAISVGFNIVLNLILVRFMAHSGLALATSIAANIAILILMFGLKKKIGSWEAITYIKCGLKSGAASTVMGFVVYTIYYYMNLNLSNGAVYEIISLLTSVAIGIIVYLALCYVFRIEEVHTLLNTVKRKLQ